ncbi:hypothetical protein DIPPA_13283 [Diplonema papillatum]|nr:hypothetical protein DIPPA_13283 [Diplonema papillatum]
MGERVQDLRFEWGPNADSVRMAIPFIHCNMGGEMAYILEQRLYSQKIRKDKIERVLNDIVRQMYNPRIFKELLRPGPLPSNTYMRGIFHTIANTSIMKLSDQSMEKMYELMVMGFKYQVLSATHPTDLIAITLNHIESNRLITDPDSVARHAVDAALVQFEDVMKRITVPQYHTIRWLLCKFFQDRRTKVSLFLRENIQTEKGYFPLTCGGPMPNDVLVEMPGVVRYYENGALIKTEAFAHPLALKITTQRKNDHFSPPHRDVTLGFNLYISRTQEQHIRAVSDIGKPAALWTAPAVPPSGRTAKKSPRSASHARVAVQLNPAAQSADDLDEEPALSTPEVRDQDQSQPFSDADFLGQVMGKKGTEEKGGFKFAPFGDQAPASSGEVIDIQGMSREQFQAINKELVSYLDELEVLEEVYKDKKSLREGSCSSLLDLLVQETT